MSVVANFLKDVNGQLRLLMMLALVASVSVTTASADVGDEEEYYDEFEDTSFEFADEEYEVEVSRTEDLRARRRGRIISRSYMFEGPYMGVMLQHSGLILRDNASTMEKVTQQSNANAVPFQPGGDSGLHASPDNSGVAVFLGFGEVLERERLYFGGEFTASTVKKRYNYVDDHTTYFDIQNAVLTTTTRDVRAGTSTTETKNEQYILYVNDDIRARSVEIDYDLDLSARMGYLLQPNHMIYTQIGYSMGFYNLYSRGVGDTGDDRSESLPSNLPKNSGSGLLHGWNFGFGSEVAVGPRMAFRMGWVVRDYDDSFDKINSANSSPNRNNTLNPNGDNSRQYAGRSYSLQVGLTFYPGSEGEHKNMSPTSGMVGDGFYAGMTAQHTNAAYKRNRTSLFTNLGPSNAIPGGRIRLGNTLTIYDEEGKTPIRYVSTEITSGSVRDSSSFTSASNDYGQDFFGFSGFVGYGMDVGRAFGKSALDGVYLGGEMEFGGPATSEVASESKLTPLARSQQGRYACSYSEDSFKRGGEVALLGRLGYRPTPQTLVYFKGGYGWSRFRAESRDSILTSASLNGCNFAGSASLINTTETNEKYTLGNYRVGLGIESAIYDNMFMRMDWTYLRHEDRGETIAPRTGVSTGRAVNYGGFDDNRISVGFGYTFDGMGM